MGEFYKHARRIYHELPVGIWNAQEIDDKVRNALYQVIRRNKHKSDKQFKSFRKKDRRYIWRIL